MAIVLKEKLVSNMTILEHKHYNRNTRNNQLKNYLVLVVLLLVLFSQMAQCYSEQNNYYDLQVTYTVKSGDTAWNVAEMLKEQYGDYRDIREIIYVTDGASSTLIPGQKLQWKLRAKK